MSLSAAALILAWVAITLVSLAVAALFRHLQLLTTRSEQAESGLGVGQSTEGFGLPAGSRVRSGLSSSGLGVVVFVKTSCASCHRLLDQLASPPGTEALDGLDPILVTNGTCSAEGGAQLPQALCIDAAGAEFDLLKIPATPWLMLVDATGTIARSGPAGSIEAVAALVADARQLQAAVVPRALSEEEVRP